MFKYVLISFISAFGALKLQGTLFELNTFHFIFGIVILFVLFKKENIVSMKDILIPVKIVNLAYFDRADILRKNLLSKVKIKTSFGYERYFNGVLIRKYSEIEPFCPSGSTLFYLYNGVDTPTGSYLVELIIIDKNNNDITAKCITALADFRVKEESRKNEEKRNRFDFVSSIGSGQKLATI